MRTWENVSTVHPAPSPSSDLGRVGRGSVASDLPSPSDLWLALVCTRSNLLVKKVRNGFQASWFCPIRNCAFVLGVEKGVLLLFPLNGEQRGLPLVLPWDRTRLAAPSPWERGPVEGGHLAPLCTPSPETLQEHQRSGEACLQPKKQRPGSNTDTAGSRFVRAEGSRAR